MPKAEIRQNSGRTHFIHDSMVHPSLDSAGCSMSQGPAPEVGGREDACHCIIPAEIRGTGSRHDNETRSLEWAGPIRSHCVITENVGGGLSLLNSGIMERVPQARVATLLPCPRDGAKVMWPGPKKNLAQRIQVHKIPHIHSDKTACQTDVYSVKNIYLSLYRRFLPLLGRGMG